MTSAESIDQSNVSGSIIPGEARLSGTTAKSVFNSKIEETVPQKTKTKHAQISSTEHWEKESKIKLQERQERLV